VKCVKSTFVPWKAQFLIRETLDKLCPEEGGGGMNLK